MLRKGLAVLIILYLSAPAFAENKKIIISATDWAPYTAKKLPNGGFFTEICQQALSRVGYASEVKFFPWKRAILMTKKGECHALMGASYTEKRTEYFSYPTYYWGISINFFARKGHTFSYRNVEDLCPAKLGMFLGSSYVERFRDYNCFTIQMVPTTQQNIKKLASHRIDLFLDAKDSVTFYLNKELSEHASAIEPLYPPLETDKIYMVISKQLKNYHKIRTDFDKGIEIIRNDGTFNKILKKHGI